MSSHHVESDRYGHRVDSSGHISVHKLWISACFWLAQELLIYRCEVKDFCVA